jgi:predicted lipid-binding transport protein (Tim44 family)
MALTPPAASTTGTPAASTGALSGALGGLGGSLRGLLSSLGFGSGNAFNGPAASGNLINLLTAALTSSLLVPQFQNMMNENQWTFGQQQNASNIGMSPDRLAAQIQGVQQPLSADLINQILGPVNAQLGGRDSRLRR